MTGTHARRTPARPSLGEPVGIDASNGILFVDAGTSWYLDSSDHVWRVIDGRVDIFAVSPDQRIPVGSILPGESLGRRHISSDGRWEVIAIGIPGTQILEESEPSTSEASQDWIHIALSKVASQLSDDQERLEHLALHDTTVLREAENQLAGVGLSRAMPSYGVDDALGAVTDLAIAEGFAAPVDVKPQPGPAFDRVQQVAESIPARARAVTLDAQWWQKPGDGFITTDTTGRLVTVLPRRRHNPPYQVLIDGTSTPLTVKQGTELSREAIVLQPITGAAAVGLKGLLRATRQQVRAEFLWMGVLAFASALVGLLVPITLGAIVNAAVPNRSSDQVIGLVSLLVAASISGFIFDLVRNLAVLRVGGEFDRALLPAVWDRILRLPVSFFRSYDVGDLASRIPAIDRARTSATDAIVIGGVSIIFATVNLILIALVVPSLFIATLGVLGIYGFVVFIALRGAFAAQKRALQYGAERDAMGLQLIRGIAKIRVAGATATMFARWIRLLTSTSRQQQSQALRMGVVSVASGSLALIASALAYAITIAGGATIPLGSFVIFASSLTLAVGAVSALAELVAVIGFARTLFERIRPVLNTETEDRTRGSRISLDGSISFQDLHFGYGEVPVLAGFTLDIPAGSFTALVGASGCGKSTVLRCLLGFEQPDRGSIFLTNRPLRDLDLTHIRRQFGVVPQRLTLLGGTLLENIVGSRALTEDDAWEAAARVGLAEFIESLPMKMQTVLVDGGSTLSGGQLQRLMLARAVAGKPKLILLDEATSALDNPSQQLVTDSLAQMSATRLVVAHRLSTVRDADQIAVMDAGRVVELGTHEELLAAGGAYAELVSRQL